MRYMMLWNPQICQPVHRELPDLLQWHVTDEAAGGRVHFMTNVGITGARLSDLPQVALYRMACYFLIGKLDERSLADAFQSLNDTYAWQIDRESEPAQITAQQRVAVGGERQLERTPFALDLE